MAFAWLLLGDAARVKGMRELVKLRTRMEMARIDHLGRLFDLWENPHHRASRSGEQRSQKEHKGFGTFTNLIPNPQCVRGALRLAQVVPQGSTGSLRRPVHLFIIYGERIPRVAVDD